MPPLILAFGTPGFGEIVVILAIALVLFGGERLPEFARTLAHAYREGRRWLNAWNDPEEDPEEDGDGKPSQKTLH